MRTVSIIIPTYNRAEFIGLTIDSFLQQNYPPDKFEIIVVNNNSTDNTEVVVKEMATENPVIKYVEEKRQGVHYARNTAIQYAKGEVLYYTDDDMIADRNLLKNLVTVFDVDPKIASVGGRILPKWEIDPPDWVIKYCSNTYLSLNPDDTPLIVSDQMISIFSCHQALLKNALIKAGGFNPENTKGEWVGDGETGLALKLLDLGYKLGYTGISLIHHIIPKTRMTQAYLNKRFANQGNCDSYTKYRQKKGLSNKELKWNIWESLKSLSYYSLSTPWQLLKFNDSWRIPMALVFYYKNRILYDYRLMSDASWRQFVLKENWIEV